MAKSHQNSVKAAEGCPRDGATCGQSADGLTKAQMQSEEEELGCSVECPEEGEEEGEGEDGPEGLLSDRRAESSEEQAASLHGRFDQD